MTDPRPVPLDLAPVADVVERVLAHHDRALAAVRTAAADLATAVDVVAGRFAAGGRLWLVAADAVAARTLDLVAADLVAEFGLAEPAVVRTDAGPPDPTARDAVLVVTTGGDATAALTAARRRAAGLVLVTTAPTTERADAVVAVPVGDEPVAGLTRVGGASALKAALDAVTTGVVAQLGRVYDDLPVDLVATTDEQRERVVAMVGRIAGVDPDTAARAALAGDHDVRVAVLSVVAGLGPAEAATLAANRRTLRDALAGLPQRPPESAPRGA